FQEVAAWPRELFYSRPTPVPTATAPYRSSAAQPALREQPTERNDSGDPFSPTEQLLNLDPISRSPIRPNGRTTSALVPSSSNLSGLNMFPPGGDALSRSLMQAAPTGLS